MVAAQRRAAAAEMAAAAGGAVEEQAGGSSMGSNSDSRSLGSTGASICSTWGREVAPAPPSPAPSSNCSSAGSECSLASQLKRWPALDLQDSAADTWMEGGAYAPSACLPQLPLGLGSALLQARPPPQRILVRMVLASGGASAPAALPRLAAAPLTAEAEIEAQATEEAPAPVPGGPQLPPCSGPALVHHPDGSRQLVLLLSSTAAERAAAARPPETQPSAPATYQAPASQDDVRTRAAIEQADEAMRRVLRGPRPTPRSPSGEQPARPPSPDNWLRRVRAADAALRSAVERADVGVRARRGAAAEGPGP